ncbi:hypothetical protein ABT148_25010 [Streptomyces sp. NPDC001725]|uniref:hypothetical protein n=1 Tax=unclassified Streptomyces TaxID=2593676 RepID=UPI00333426EB
MTSELIHLIVRKTEDGLYATSPQLPGFVYGRQSLAELRTDLSAALSFHTGEPGPHRVLEHHERCYDVAGGEVVTRLAFDERASDRQLVYERIGQTIRDPKQASSLAHGVANQVGEVVFVCALPSDTLGWLSAQLSEPLDAFYAAVAISDQMLLTLPFAHGEAHAGIGQTYVAGAKGYTAETTLSEIIRSTRVVTPTPYQVEARA